MNERPYRLSSTKPGQKGAVITLESGLLLAPGTQIEHTIKGKSFTVIIADQTGLNDKTRCYIYDGIITEQA